jgi:hypothetical protein
MKDLNIKEMEEVSGGTSIVGAVVAAIKVLFSSGTPQV